VGSCRAWVCPIAAQADDAPSAADNLKGDQSVRRQGGQEAGEKQMNAVEGGQSKGDKTIKGEVLRVEGEY
jgi:hypothetical protein